MLLSDGFYWAYPACQPYCSYRPDGANMADKPDRLCLQIYRQSRSSALPREGWGGASLYFFLNSRLPGSFCHLPFTANFSVLPSFFLYEYVPSFSTFSTAMKSSLP